MIYRYHHIGIPTDQRMPGMVHLKHLKIFATDHTSNPFGIQWMKYEEGADYPLLVRTIPHVAFEVDDLNQAIAGKHVLIAPNSPSPGVMVAIIEQDGAPVEFLQYRVDTTSR